MRKNINLKISIAVGALVLGVAAFPTAAFAVADTGSTTVNVTVGSQITLGNGSTTVNINPTLGSTGTAVQTLTVTTNHAAGYTLSIQMNNASTSLMNGLDAITATSNGSTPAALQNNTWGWNSSTSSSVAAATFKTIPAQGSPANIASSVTTASAAPVYVTFGAQPTASLASGTYTGSVLYTATTNP